MTEKTILTQGVYRVTEVYDSDVGIYVQHLYKNGREVNVNSQGWSMTQEEARQHIAEYESFNF
ncbi:MAG: hypothetical protein IKO57_13415 [Treponema sp.]|nr:hypothetical protein [Treponema sp.]MBR6913502.1 hypothetical protein [Treponema sp.]